MSCLAAAGLALGAAVDRGVGDPRAGHPVAAYGRVAAGLERRLWAPTVRRGGLYAAIAVGVPVLAAVAADRRVRHHPALRLLLTGAVTWSVLGGTTLRREADVMRDALAVGDLSAARRQLPSLCGRDAVSLDAGGLARATVESVAENTSDAVVAALAWGAVLGTPGLVAYRCMNTLDAMVGHRSLRFDRFGRVCARLDDIANLVPARLTGLLAVVLAPLVDGSPRDAWRVLRRDGWAHPSPNSGQCEAAFAGALGVRLGGTNVYGTRVEVRPTLGDGAAPTAADIARATSLSAAVERAALLLALAVAWRRR